MMKFFALLFLLLLAGETALAQQPASVDETARFLAGLPVAGALEPLMRDPGWQEHAAAMDEAWAKKQRQQIDPISAWMEQNAPSSYSSTETMFYMFSGPDFLYANIFFPRANTYILAGLEPLGQAPDLTRMPPAMVASELAALRASMSSILRFQYFITKDMRAGLGAGNITGTVPILYVFLARLGYAIVDVTHVNTPTDGVKITFESGNGRQTLYYFKTDLSGGNSAFLKWCAARGPGLSLLKAASYLMHGDGFAGVRNFLLEHSRVIVQDDSGIPLRAFPRPWVVSVFGRYVPHTEEFAKYWQPELAALFQKEQPAELGFAFGYHWQPNAGILLLATRAGAPAASALVPATAAKSERPKTNRPPRVLRALPVEKE